MSPTPTTKKSPRPSIEDLMRDRFAEARRLIVSSVIEQAEGSEEVDLSGPYNLSTQLLGQYVTLDFDHWKSVRHIRSLISRYADDRTRRRPLNIMMQAEPGSGKSHLVKSLARSLEHKNAGAVDYNMASLQTLEDLLQPLDAVRNLKVQDKLPILFIDEFDSDPDRYPLLLPLLWDGELNIAHRNLKLGKLVVVLAGSGKTISSTMAIAKAMQTGATGEGKLVDLLSRINGGELEIPPLDLVNQERDRRADKVCLTISLLEARFGTAIEIVPRSLLSFVARSRFRYGVRSLAHLVDFIEPFATSAQDGKEVSSKQLRLPLTSVSALRESSLAYHVFSEDGPAAIVECWKEVSKEEIKVRIRQEAKDEDDIVFS
jgi:DNA helicase HerA-like ATPase